MAQKKQTTQKRNTEKETATVGQENEKNPKRLRGTVVSNAMQKTLVVRVDRLIEHPKYKKRYTVSRRYKVHYDEGDYNLGDLVTIQESRPISKEKRWRVVSVNTASTNPGEAQTE